MNSTRISQSAVVLSTPLNSYEQPVNMGFHTVVKLAILLFFAATLKTAQSQMPPKSPPGRCSGWKIDFLRWAPCSEDATYKFDVLNSTFVFTDDCKVTVKGCVDLQIDIEDPVEVDITVHTVGVDDVLMEKTMDKVFENACEKLGNMKDEPLEEFKPILSGVGMWPPKCPIKTRLICADDKTYYDIEKWRQVLPKIEGKYSAMVSVKDGNDDELACAVAIFHLYKQIGM